MNYKDNCKSDIDQSLYEWIWALENEEDGENEMRQKVEALIQIGQDEGVKSVVAEKSKSLLCMLEYMSRKQASGEEVLRAHENFIPLQHSVLQTRDSVIREELSREDGISNIKRAISSIEALFEKCKVFLALEPTEEEFSGCIPAFRPDPFSDDLDQASLATMLEQASCSTQTQQ